VAVDPEKWTQDVADATGKRADAAARIDALEQAIVDENQRHADRLAELQGKLDDANDKVARQDARLMKLHQKENRP
jgi:chromosome segregation ATPase